MKCLKMLLGVGLLVNGVIFGADQKSANLSLENLKSTVQEYFAELSEYKIEAIGVGLGVVAVALSVRSHRLSRLEQSSMLDRFEILKKTVEKRGARVAALEALYSDDLRYTWMAIHKLKGDAQVAEAEQYGYYRDVVELRGAQTGLSYKFEGMQKRVETLEQRLAPVVVKPVPNALAKVDVKPADQGIVNFFETPKIGC